jgi:GNAT superfamily N-acetyltransferase
MNPRAYTLGPATARIRRTDFMSAHMLRHVRELCDLYVPPGARRQGHGAELVRAICREADAAGLVLLVRSPHDEAWFRRLGFVRLQDEPLVMTRNPGTNPRPDLQLKHNHNVQISMAVQILLRQIAAKKPLSHAEH